MKRSWKIGIAAVVVAGALGATAAFARPGGPLHGGRGGHGPGHGQMMKRHVAAFVDDALDEAKATPEQREKIAAARDRAFAALAETHKGRGPQHLAEAAALFEADRLDEKKIAAFRDEHRARAKQAGDAIVEALTAAHDTLAPAQRRAVADYVRGHLPGRHGAAMKGEFMKRMMAGRIDEALDKIGATPVQREAIEAARDHAFAAVQQARNPEQLRAVADRALALFVADRVDPAAIAALRAEQEARMEQVGEALAQALRDVHDTLTAPQRKALVEHVKAERGKWHGRFRGGPGGDGPAPLPGDEG